MKYLLLTVLLCFASAAKLPASFKYCKAADPNINECLKDAILSDIKDLDDGYPALKIPALKALEIPSMTIPGGTGPVQVEQKYKNVVMVGMTDFVITKIDANLAEHKLEIETINPAVSLLADYDLDGKLLVMPVKGSGRSNITCVDMKIQHTIKTKTVSKKGVAYWEVESFTVKLNPGRVYYDFQNLFNGNEQLGAQINNVMNENWKEVFDDVANGYEQIFGIIFKDQANKIFRSIPLNQLFLE